MKTLVICRHAKSDWDAGRSDFDRPLNGRGRKDAPRMGEALAKAGFAPDRIYSSPAARARATAIAVADALSFSKPIQYDDRLYEQGHGSVLGVLQGTPREAETVMVFGHNPTLELLADLLLQGTQLTVLPTCAMLALEFPIQDWQDLGSVAGQVRWLIVPRLLV